jgi:hypothetical protein
MADFFSKEISEIADFNLLISLLEDIEFIEIPRCRNFPNGACRANPYS